VKLIWMTRKKHLRLAEEILAQVMIANYMSQEVRGNDTPEVQSQQLRIFIAMALDNVLFPRSPWRLRRRKGKPCEPVPCPPWEEVRFDLET